MIDDSRDDGPKDFFAELEAARAQDQKDNLMLDPEQASETTKNLAAMEKEILELVREKYGHTSTVKNIYPGVEVYNPGYRTQILSIKEHLGGLGNGKIYLRSAIDDPYPGEPPESAIIPQLYIGLHTDEDTRKLAEQLSNSSNSFNFFSLGTQYYFGSDGTYLKRVYVPLNGSENRNRSQADAWETRRMTAGDFELAGVALQMLKARLSPPEPTE